jgi:hypothetical protein
MANFAVLNQDSVENIIIADSKVIAEQITEKECIEFTASNNAGISYTYDRETGMFINPFPDPIL